MKHISIQNADSVVQNGALSTCTLVYCSPGTYNEDGKCKFCEVGLYQDEQGKSECKKCPPGKSTAFMGSTDVDDCTGNRICPAFFGTVA